MKYLAVILLVLISALGCSKKGEGVSRNIEQIQREEGIPVRIEEVTESTFDLFLSYNSVLTNSKETTINAMVADRVEKIFVRIGDFVENNQLLISFPENNPSVQYNQAKLAYESAESTYRRMKVLYDIGGISQQEFEQIETAMNINKANYEAVSKTIKVTAPFAGFVTAISVQESESVGFGDPLVTISDSDTFNGRIWVVEKDINSFKEKMPATAHWNGNKLAGEVTRISRSMDRSRQAFTVDLIFQNSDKLNLSGIMAEIVITTQSFENSIVIPRQYLISDTSGDYVFIAKGNYAEKRKVTIAETDIFNFRITEGISAGEQLITQGATLVSDNALIKITQ